MQLHVQRFLTAFKILLTICRGSIMNYIKIFVLTLIVWFAQRSIASKIPSDFTSISSLLQSRIKRDNDYEVKCHQSGTGV